ncbi:MAG: FAD-dependent thymidylate synthase [Bacteroidota bacterium]|nr:FAD-dependent thymidylate synthase [Bacteroidota bacterium]
MEVKLISYSQPLKEDVFTDWNAKELIAYAARVSNPDNQNNKETVDRLLKYLIKHQHWSPFEMVSACLEITTTRDIARQILRHRSFSFQEFSQRYADPTQSLKRVTRDARLQDTKNRQNSIETEDDELQNQWTIQQDTVWLAAFNAFKWALELGIAKVQARAVLP